MKKRSVWFGVAAAVALMTAGCQSKYEKIEIESHAAGISENKAERTTESSPVVGTDAPTAAVVTVGANAAPTAAPTTAAAPETAAASGAASTTAASGAATTVAVSGAATTAAASGTATTAAALETASTAAVETTAAQKNAQAVAETTAAASRNNQTCASASQSAGEVGLNMDWKYASLSKINSGKAVLYRSEAASRKNKVVCVNAGHGTSGGSSVKTQCHPDGTPKVTSGTTSAGATTAVAVSGGMTFADGTPEAKVTLAMAKMLKDKLLARGYDVLMIRESDDVQLDNVARTVLANNLADCHIALHWDSTKSNKGAFYMSVPNVASYRAMEPVASHWQQHNALGESLVAGLKGAGVKIFSGGSMEMDLTQTSYSTIPSVDIELGDGGSDHSAATLDKLGTGLADGVDAYFGK